MIEYSVNISGFKTPEAALEFVRWFEGQGEQDIVPWWEAAQDSNPAVGSIPRTELPLNDMIVGRTAHVRVKHYE